MLEPPNSEALLGIIAVVAAAWGLFRSGAISGWKSVAEARKERILEIEANLARAEEREASLGQQIASLEKRQDMSAVIARIDKLAECVDELKEAVHDLAARWG